MDLIFQSCLYILIYKQEIYFDPYRMPILFYNPSK